MPQAPLGDFLMAPPLNKLTGFHGVNSPAQSLSGTAGVREDGRAGGKDFFGVQESRPKRGGKQEATPC